MLGAVVRERMRRRGRSDCGGRGGGLAPAALAPDAPCAPPRVAVEGGGSNDTAAATSFAAAVSDPVSDAATAC